jgi:hypothetical protein
VAKPGFVESAPIAEHEAGLSVSAIQRRRSKNPPVRVVAFEEQEENKDDK